MRVGIALYSPLVPSEGRHWALIVSQPGQNSLSGTVNVYQIVYDRSGTNPVLYHRTTDNSRGAKLQASNRYYGVVDLGPIRADPDIFLAVIEDQEAAQGTYSLPWGKRWSCAWWVIRTLRSLRRNGFSFNVPSDDLVFYETVVGSMAYAMAVSFNALRSVSM